ncbi:MAG: MBOAT family protein [Lachnospiraceae bacterium]|nr:MBOAT family protein [Lachnospiraceae bacterium]
MLFNSYLFIFIFLPLALFGYFGLNRFRKYRGAKLFLSLMSLWFYAYFNPVYLWIILCSILLNYGISFLTERASERSSSAESGQKKPVSRLALAAGLIFNLGLFFYFKYFDFFIENVNALFRQDFALRHILLPLGISFFTFQQLSFVIDRARGQAEHCPFIDYLTFVTFFPQLVAGPIVLHSELLPQFRDIERKKIDPESFSRGIILFTLGLGKKVLLADVLAQVVNYGFSNALLLDSVSTLLMMLAYTFQIYFDFSGYSDMAIGLGLLFHIDLPVNFDSPYKACTVRDLWQRWHITLSRFFVRYVYIPLGGSKKGRARTLFNIFLVFFLSGIWHGANWTYIAWGTMQGLLVVWDNLGLVGAESEDGKIRPKLCIPRPLGRFLTFSFFNLSLLFFGSDSLKTAFTLFKNLFSFTVTGHLYKMVDKLSVPEFYPLTKLFDLKLPQYGNYLNLGIFLLVLLISALLIRGKNARTIALNAKLSGKTVLWAAVLFVWCVISFEQVSTFIYFNF